MLKEKALQAIESQLWKEEWEASLLNGQPNNINKVTQRLEERDDAHATV